MKMYIAVLDEVPDYMTPTLVAHAVLAYHQERSIWWKINPDLSYSKLYVQWLNNSFKKCILRVNQKEFAKISELPYVGLFHESTILEAKKCCAVLVVDEDVPNVLKFAKLWKPKES